MSSNLVKRVRPFANALIAVATLLMSLTEIEAQTSMGTGINYSRSSMKLGSQVLDGVYDFEFKLFDAATGGNLVGDVVTRDDIDVNDGKLPTQTLNFGQ